MKAGHELNVWIAENVFGSQTLSQADHTFEVTLEGSKPLPHYSTDVGAAWAVVERLGITLIPVENGHWFALVGKEVRWKSPADFMQFLQTADFVESGAAVAETPAFSICLAAYQALENRRKHSVAVTADMRSTN